MELPHNHWDFTGRRQLGSDDDHPKPKPVPMHKWWSQVQKLYPSDPHIYRLFGDEVAIWGDSIAVSGPGESLTDSDWFTPGDHYQFGSVYMFSRESFSTDSWTQQQKLYNPDANDGIIFNVSVDTLYQNNYLALNDLDNNRFGKPRLYGSSLTVTSAGDTPYSAYTYFMTDNVDWKCLQITVGDGMGDGWDNARLVATAPFGPTREVKTDTFSQFCDAYNYDKRDETKPLSRKTQETYRYCPLDGHNAGDYVFEILGNPRGEKGNKGTPSDDLYWREIYWDIYNELDGKRYIGDAHTKMVFNWGAKDFFFTIKKKETERLWKADAKCTQCQTWKGLHKTGQNQPKQKPKANSPSSTDDDISRRLNLYPTPAPTGTVAPTLTWAAHSYVDQWKFVMGRNTTSTSPNSNYGSTTAWQNKYKNGTGTYFYIYDSNGMNITEPLIWGQLCTLTGTFQDSCGTQDLPVGGTYTLRVTGGMDYRRNEIQWKFCNVIGHAQQTLIFTKYSATCHPIVLYDSDQMCEKNGFKVKADGTVVLKGLSGMYAEERDNVVIEAAFKTMLHPYVASNINIFVVQETLHASSSEDVVVRAELEFDSTRNEISVGEMDGLHTFETSLIEKLGYYDDNNMITSVLSSAARDLLGEDSHTIMSGASFESHVTNFQIMKAEPQSYKVYRDRVQSEFSQNLQDTQERIPKAKMDHAHQMEYDILNAEAIGGYVVMSCAVMAVLLVGLVTWHQSWKTQHTNSQNHLKESLDVERLGEAVGDNALQQDWKIKGRK